MCDVSSFRVAGLARAAVQGQVQLWVDILTPEQAKMYPITNISPPPPLEAEVRNPNINRRTTPLAPVASHPFRSLWPSVCLPGAARSHVTWQVRVVVWRTRNVVDGDTSTNQSDLFAKVWLEGQEPQKTDTHLRYVVPSPHASAPAARSCPTVLRPT